MLPYWLLFAVFALGAVAHRRAAGSRISTPLFWLCALLMAGMIGLRYEVGPDWDGYLYMFEGVSRQKLDTAFEHGDPAFFGLLWLARALDLEIWAVNLVCAAIFTIGLMAFAKRQQNPWLTIAVAIPYLVIVIAMSATRQATAIGFILLGLAAFADKSLYRFMIWIFVGALFHASALLMLPIVGLSYTRNRFQSVVLLCLAAYPAYYLLAANFEIYIDRYTNDNTESQGTVYRIMMSAVPAIIYMIASKKFSLETHEKTLWRNLAILALICVPLMFVFPSSTALDRVALYVIPLQLFVFGNLPAVIAIQKDYMAILLGVIGYLALILFVYLNYSAHGKYYIPYQLTPLS
jgi:hypothetical protein